MIRQKWQWFAFTWWILAPMAVCAAEVKAEPTLSLPPSTLSLSTKPQADSAGYTDSTNFYQSSFTNQYYKLLGNRLFAIKQQHTFQYDEVDIWPASGDVSIYTLEQKKSEKAGDTTGFDHRTPITLGNAGKPLLTLPTEKLTTYSIALDGKLQRLDKLPDNEPQFAINKALLEHTTRTCCSVPEGTSTYYSLRTGEKLVEHRWTDSGFIAEDSKLYNQNSKGDWLLVYVQAPSHSPKSRKLSLKLQIYADGEPQKEVNFKAELPQPLEAMCGDWCHLTISAPATEKNETLPYLPAPTPVTISFKGANGESTPLAILRMLPDGVPAVTTPVTSNTLNSPTK